VYATGAVVGNTLAPSKALALVWPVAGLIQLRPATAHHRDVCA
jgi:hypothetical protein